MQQQQETLIFRQVAFPLSSFDYLKDFQRGVEAKTGKRITNNQALALILADHQRMNEARGVRNGQAEESKARG